MTGRWNTHRGDDWWYAGGTAVADGAYSSCPAIFEITSIGGSKLEPQTLYDLLWQTLQQFAGANVYFVLNGTTQAAAADLAACSLVEWQEFKQPYSTLAKVISVVPPNYAIKGTSV